MAPPSPCHRGTRTLARTHALWARRQRWQGGSTRSSGHSGHCCRAARWRALPPRPPAPAGGAETPAAPPRPPTPHATIATHCAHSGTAWQQRPCEATRSRATRRGARAAMSPTGSTHGVTLPIAHIGPTGSTVGNGVTPTRSSSRPAAELQLSLTSRPRPGRRVHAAPTRRRYNQHQTLSTFVSLIQGLFQSQLHH